MYLNIYLNKYIYINIYLDIYIYINIYNNINIYLNIDIYTSNLNQMVNGPFNNKIQN